MILSFLAAMYLYASSQRVVISSWMFTLLLLCCLIRFEDASAVEADSPNVIVMMSDDQGVPTMDLWGTK